LLPWISVYVYDGNLFNAPDDPNLFQTVAVGNSISGGARVAAAVFGLILIGLATAIQFTSARGVVARRRAYVYGIALAALSVLGMVGCGQAAEEARGIQHEGSAASPSPVEELTKLADLLEKGLLTREEFDLMKANLLGRPTI
jgi:hypothetical protein